MTLNEAYAFRETLTSTEDSRYGPQHAAYEINLTGSGDLVVELDKGGGKRMEIGLPPGPYGVVPGDRDDRLQASVTEGSRSTLTEADFRTLASVPTVARGAEDAPASGLDRIVSFMANRNVVIGGGAFSHGLFSSKSDRAVSLNVFRGQVHDRRGMQFGSLLNADSGNMRGFQLAGLGNAVKGEAFGLQLASLVNISDTMRGVLLGLVNYESGGVFSPQIWTEGGTSFRTGLALGTRFVYTLASVGLGLGTEARSPSASLGLGGRLAIGHFFGDLDLPWRGILGASGRLDFSSPSARLEASRPRTMAPRWRPSMCDRPLSSE